MNECETWPIGIRLHMRHHARAIKTRRSLVLIVLAVLLGCSGLDPASARPAAGPEEITLDLGSDVQLELIRIPPGEFMMGETDWSRALIGLFANHDLRARQAKITKAFYLGKYEVTVEQFRRFVEENGYQTDAETGRRSWRELEKGCYTMGGGNWGPKSDASWRSPGFPQSSDHPVTCISWYDAVEFCRWLSGKTGLRARLPTEGELEYGQRAPDRHPLLLGQEAGRLRPGSPASHRLLGQRSGRRHGGRFRRRPVPDGDRNAQSHPRGKGRRIRGDGARGEVLSEPARPVRRHRQRLGIHAGLGGRRPGPNRPAGTGRWRSPEHAGWELAQHPRRLPAFLPAGNRARRTHQHPGNACPGGRVIPTYRDVRSSSASGSLDFPGHNAGPLQPFQRLASPPPRKFM